MDRPSWDAMLKRNGWNTFELRENRYNQIAHMVTSANGAEEFYTTKDHRARTENLDLARVVDEKASGAWLGHPYFDLIDNSTDFENKIIRLISTICKRMELDTGDRLNVTAKKYKFLGKNDDAVQSLKIPLILGNLIIFQFAEVSRRTLSFRRSRTLRLPITISRLTRPTSTYRIGCENAERTATTCTS